MTSDQLASGLQQDETLTINGGYSVTLQAGMTLAAAAEKINGVLDGNHVGMQATVVDDRLQLQSNFYGSNYAVSISSTLDDGAGGTGLGGATAGSVNTAYGANVEGTIGGKKAAGWGQWLTGSEGSAKDLKLKITATETGDRGVVKVSEGLGSRLSHYAAQVTDAKDGLLTRAGNSLSDGIDRIAEDTRKMEASVSTYVEQMQLKFATLEGLMAKNKTTLEYLQGQMTSLKSGSVNTSA
jgi:flagellar capping protein FliD